MSEMHGGCDHYAWNMNLEFEAWSKTSKPLSASNDKKTALLASRIPLAEKVGIELQPQDNVTFVAIPEKKFGEPSKSFGGLIPFQVAKDGVYRVSAGNKIWFDVLDAPTGKALESTAFEMQSGCNKILKSVAFQLQAENRYLLQVSSSAQRSIDLLITPAPATAPSKK